MPHGRHPKPTSTRACHANQLGAFEGRECAPRRVTLSGCSLARSLWESAFIQTGTSIVRKVSKVSCGVLDGLVVALAGASPALPGISSLLAWMRMDEEVKNQLIVGAKSTGFSSQGNTGGDQKWDPEKMVQSERQHQRDGLHAESTRSEEVDWLFR